MKVVIFAIFDVKSESYGPPFVTRTVAEGLRYFSDMLNDPQGMMCKHREDFRLFRLGDYDAGLGVLYPSQTGPVLVEDGLQLVKEA